MREKQLPQTTAHHSPEVL